MDVATARGRGVQRSLWMLALIAALMAGALLRLLWVEDIEYKRDEQLIFQRAQQACQTGTWPWLGEESSVGVRTPGMSHWGFILIGHVLGTADPTALARGVQITNVAALVLFVGFVLWNVPLHEREAWFWALALAAVNPLAVLYQRKIWNPSLFPLVTLCFLVGWWRRQRNGGAFLWGLVGACLGQIQMAGFFFAGGFAAWAWLFDRGNTRWRAWLAGSVVGALPLPPWLYHLGTQLDNGPAHAVKWTRWITGHYFSRWVSYPLGLSVDFSLGDDFEDFLSHPILAGWPTYLVAIAHGLILLLGLMLLLRAFARWRQQQPPLATVIGKGSSTAFTVAAALWGYGILLTLSSLPVQRHYFLVAFPLGFVWLARLALGPAPQSRRWGRWVLLGLCLAQALITATFLGYVHQHQRQLRGDYGTPYGAQAQVTGPARR